MCKVLTFLTVIALAIGLTASPTLAHWQLSDGHKMHFPQMPDEAGWDVMATYPIVLADDWQCTEAGPVKDIHFWGSWKNDAPGTITKFWLSIHDNIPGPPSMPGNTLWEAEITDFSVQQIDPPSSEGWYDPSTGEIITDDHWHYFQYNVFLPENLWFYQTAGQIYWLNICADVVEETPAKQWGWKTSQDHFMDDAVWAYFGVLDWVEMYEPDPEPPLVNTFWAMFDGSGYLIEGGGDDPYGLGWYYYENTEWWNIWFYDHPLVRGKKYVHIEFVWEQIGPNPFILFAFNWSTDLWEIPGQPPIPPLTPPEEEMYIGRQIFEVPPVPGFYAFDFEIPFYNPEWVSVDFMGTDVSITNGLIAHQCIPSLDLAFVITANEQAEDPVYDLWETPQGHNTYVEFGCGPNTPAIPADFFGPGSDPFDGVISFKGDTLSTAPADVLGPTDTIVRRNRAVDLPECPSTDQVETQMVALDLVSVEPITVTYNGGQDPEDWDIRVCLSEVAPQPSGTMTFNWVCPDGGTFGAIIPVIPKFIFRRISDGQEWYLDYGDMGLFIEYIIDDGHWLFTDPGFNVYTSNGTELVSNCDDIPDIPIGPSAVDLIPGLQAIPCLTCYDPATDYDIPITSLIESYYCAQQDIWPPHPVAEPIPTLNEWGMIILALLLLTAGTIAIVRRRKAVASKV